MAQVRIAAGFDLDLDSLPVHHMLSTIRCGITWKQIKHVGSHETLSILPVPIKERGTNLYNFGIAFFVWLMHTESRQQRG